MDVEPNAMSNSYFSFLSLVDYSIEFVNLVKEFSVLGFKILAITLSALLRNIVPRSKKDLKKEIVLITGSAHGIGRQLAIEIAKLGAKVVLWDINKEDLQKVSDEIVSDGGQASSYVCDVTSEREVKAKAEIVAKEVGDVTILINNAGIMQNVPILELDSEKIKRTFDVNTLSNFWTIRAFLPKMQENNYGQIVAIASAVGIFGHVNQTDYSASKFAVVGMMDALSQELRLKNNNIRLTTICPVTVNTGMNQHPVSRYHWLVPILNTEETVQHALNAIRREEFLITIPCRIKYCLYIGKLFPHRVMTEVMDVLEYCRLANGVPESMDETKNMAT